MYKYFSSGVKIYVSQAKAGTVLKGEILEVFPLKSRMIQDCLITSAYLNFSASISQGSETGDLQLQKYQK